MDFSVIIGIIKNTEKKTLAIIVLVGLLALASVVAWYRGQHEIPMSKTVYIKVPEAKEVVKIKRVEIPIEKIVVIEKEAATKKLDLPADIKDDPAKQITASGVLPPYEGKTNVLAVIDTGTGVSSIVAKQVPLAFMDFINKKEIGIRYGASFENNLEGDLYGRWDFFRIANAHIGVYGEVNTTGDAKAMVQAAYKW
jgi:hypothetical protein